ncbi:Translation initiation factor IF-2 [Frankliniella fusca]|uniref:Translation initiation factor IF-2 n=1 Tax=Frankliniella fusca TaxID=407009 RepID=A0AAE1LKJ7_9NEOP|nr:Translation initiation factor IF-2 [Frankliniella fusca]
MVFFVLVIVIDRKRKRGKYGDDPSAASLRHFQEHDKPRYPYNAASPDNIHLVKPEAPLHPIKKEPADASPGMYYSPGNLSPMYPGAGPSPQPTPIHSPQLPGGRTPSPGEYQASSPYGMGMGVYGGYSQQGYPHHGPGHMVPTAGGNVSIPHVRSVLLGGGSCTTAPHFSTDSVCPDVSGISVPPGVQASFSNIAEPANNGAMAAPLSPAEYAGNHPSGNYDPHAQPQGLTGPTNSLNGGFQSYTGVDPVQPVTGVSSFELQPLELNSSELYALGTWEGSLSEQMSSNLTLSGTAPSGS